LSYTSNGGTQAPAVLSDEGSREVEIPEKIGVGFTLFSFDLNSRPGSGYLMDIIVERQ
jgi:hypothetical protein